jgi:hypothetical protein
MHVPFSDAIDCVDADFEIGGYAPNIAAYCDSETIFYLSRICGREFVIGLASVPFSILAVFASRRPNEIVKPTIVLVAVEMTPDQV